MKTKIIIAALAVALGACGESAELTEARETVRARAAVIEAEAAAAVRNQQWSYNVSKDEMRGTETKTATIHSINDVNVSWPYTRRPMRLTLRKQATDGFNVFLVIEGQFVCRSYNGDMMSVKFDDGPIEKYGCNEAGNGASEAVFIGSKNKFLTKLKAAQRVTIEVPVYDAGLQQLTFNVAGLDWS